MNRVRSVETVEPLKLSKEGNDEIALLPGNYGSVGGAHVVLKTSLGRIQLIYIINSVSRPHPHVLFNLIQPEHCM